MSYTFRQANQTLNTAVWQEWFPNDCQKYKANGTATLEVFSAVLLLTASSINRDTKQMLQAFQVCRKKVLKM